MKKIKNRLIFILAIIIVTGQFGVLGTGITIYAKTKAQDYVDAMEPGWNLGNSFDAIGGETAWGNPIVSEELLKAVKEQGYNSIRIPITWDKHFNTQDNSYTIDETYFTRLDTVITQALDAGFYVMINMHHDSWSWINKMETDDTVLTKFKALWTQIANHYKDYSDKLMFESVNEPTFDGVDETRMQELLNTLNQEFFHIVRSSGGNNETRMLVLPTVYTNDSEVLCKGLYDLMTSLNDDNLIATIHYYGFWPFSVNIAGKTTFDDEVKKELEGAFDRVHKQFVENGIPVICGEYGLLGFDNNLGTIEHGEILKYFEYIQYYANKSDVLLMLWDNGQHFNRTKFTWSDPELYNIMKASWQGRSSYAKSDYVFINEETRNSDFELPLTLNGNTFEGIYHGATKLTEGTDYTYENESVTFKSTYLNKIIQDVNNVYGTAATLTIKFLSGADWNISVNYYDIPILASAKGNTNTLSIPTQFNGSKLSTMEAVYTDGSGNAGPQNWTSFKQFSETFSPDYTSNAITVNSKFFAETNDGEILLKFHFLSGEVLEYKIVKLGDVVKETTFQEEVETTPTPTPVEEVTKVTTDDEINTEDTTEDKVNIEDTENNIETNKDTGSKKIIVVVTILLLGGVLVSGIIMNKENKNK